MDVAIQFHEKKDIFPTNLSSKTHLGVVSLYFIGDRFQWQVCGKLC